MDGHILKSEVENKNKSHKGMKNEEEKQYSLRYLQQKLRDAKSRIKKGMKIKLDCEFCKGPISSDPHFLGLQILNGSFIVLDACQATSKNCSLFIADLSTHHVFDCSMNSR